MELAWAVNEGFLRSKMDAKPCVITPADFEAVGKISGALDEYYEKL